MDLKEEIGVTVTGRLYYFFFLFGATPAAYGNSQARGRIRAAGVGLYHCHSNVGSEKHLQLIPQLTAILDLQPIVQGLGSNPQPHRY